jgi:hypothetical protein
MAKITVVNPHHWLHPDGTLPHLPGLRSRAVRVAQFIEYGGTLGKREVRQTLVPCRFRPDGRACPGLMAVLKQPDDTLLVLCPECKDDEFLIHDWQDTAWAQGQPPPMPIRQLFDTGPKEESAPHSPAPPQSVSDDVQNRLARAIKTLGARLSVGEVIQLIGTSDNPSHVLQAVMASLSGPPSKSALEQFLPVLMDTWNQVPRADLGGRSPADTHASGRPPSAPEGPGRNTPCPCGSGKKFKRCCISKTN